MCTLGLCIVNMHWYRNSNVFLTIFTFGIPSYRPQGKVMFSEASVNLFTGGRVPPRARPPGCRPSSLEADPRYWQLVAATYPTGMYSCFIMVIYENFFSHALDTNSDKTLKTFSGRQPLQSYLGTSRKWRFFLQGVSEVSDKNKSQDGTNQSGIKKNWNVNNKMTFFN